MSAEAGPSLGVRAARGASTMMLGQVVRIALQMASVMVLARLLSPDNYGLMALALAVVGFAEIFRDFGLSTAAVRAPSLSVAQRDTLLWLSVAIGIGLAVLVALAAPLVAAAFDHPELTDITRVLALTFVINGAAAQYRADLNRSMRFGSLVTAEIFGLVAGVGAAVLLALAGAGYWALVAQQLVAAATLLLLAAVMARWLPHPPRRGVDVRPMVRFGVGLVATQLVGYASSNVDTLVLGARTTAEQLGYYNRGYQLLMRPLNQVRGPSTAVALPVFNRLRGDRDRAHEFLLVGQLGLGYTLVAACGLAAGAAVPIVAVFLGDMWAPVAPVLSLLAVAGGLTTLSYVGGWVYLSEGLTADLFRYSLVSLTIKVVAILVGSAYGIVGVAAGIAVAAAISWPISLWWVSRLRPLPLRRLYYGATRILVGATAGGLAAYAAVEGLRDVPALVEVVAAAIAAVVAYAVLALVVPAIRRDLLGLARLGLGALGR